MMITHVHMLNSTRVQPIQYYHILIPYYPIAILPTAVFCIRYYHHTTTILTGHPFTTNLPNQPSPVITSSPFSHHQFLPEPSTPSEPSLPSARHRIVSAVTRHRSNSAGLCLQSCLR